MDTSEEQSMAPSIKRANKRLKVGRACYTCRAKKIKVTKESDMDFFHLNFFLAPIPSIQLILIIFFQLKFLV
jgi:hypothetical protein